MLWYIFVCSMIGGISVSVTTGLGAAIVTTAMGDNQVSVNCTCQLFSHPESVNAVVQALVYLLPDRLHRSNTK